MAMCVTFTGNRSLTWRDHASGSRRRKVALFVLFNVIGLALGTIFRYVTYKRFVFAAPHPDPSLAAHDPAQLETRGVSVA